VKKKIIDKITKDFTFSNKSSDLIELKFLKNVSKTPVYLSKKTGLVFHNKFKSSLEVLEEWSQKIHSGKMDPKNNSYTDDSSGMSARHFYVLDFLNRFINIKNKRVIDFAFGEGGLLLKAKKYFNINNLVGVEHSKRNILKIKKRFKKENIKIPELYNSSIEKLILKKKTDIGILTWTLCNCSEPINIINSISENIKTNGYLIVAESSRILVPFKKPIFNYFNPKKDAGHTHPWHWSFNSLNNIFKLCGFELIKANRYFDENDLVLIFKNSKKINQKFKFDNYLNVVNFFKRWNEESKNYKSFNS
jgi:ubiquinone/menaquinone biosynthesis C-methylase UbiE|tara:strand:- start:486 stop:1400 length:915 start_codon:yes stop_codon:yes gene_type:complete